MSNDPLHRDDESADMSFADILNEFESREREARSSRPKGKKKAAAQALRGTVVGVSGDFVLIDYGAKAEGVLASAGLLDADGNLTVKRGDALDVTVTGFNSEGMATLSRVTGPRPRDWDALQRAFDGKEIIAGRVTAAVKGGFSVDVGTRAFLPASRSGTRSPAETAELVG